MTRIKNAVILLMVLFSYTCAQTKSTETPTDPTTTPTEPSSSSIDPTTSPSTTTPIPTTPPNTTTTPIPTTTTTATTPSTTTILPNTTTVQPTPSPKPTPPEFKKWSFTNQTTNQTCVIVQLALQINLTYTTSADQIIQLYDVRDNFTTPLGMSYHCNKIQVLQFTNAENGAEIIANATVSHLQLEAFHKQQSDQFSTGKDCEAIDTPDIVPIAVGCALAGLVVIVLIVYLIGRRRAQARGYLSM